MYKRILVNIELLEKRVAILEDNALEEYYIERADHQKVVGNVYKGRVTAILPGMGAAFVDLGLEKNGFLHVSDVVEGPRDLEELLSESFNGLTAKKSQKDSLPNITNLLKKGQEIMVQVVKEPIGTKGARLTTHISLPGRYLVLMPYESRIGVSKRITKYSERGRIKKEISSLNLPKDIGIIVRTAGGSCRRGAFKNEIRYLLKTWERIKREGEKARAPSLIHREYDLLFRVARDIFTNDVNRLIVDDREEFKRIAHFVGFTMPSLRLRLKYYRGETPLFERFGIEKEIAKLYENRIYLKNRGYIIIEQTEGLVAIDVNTGSFVGRKNLEETAFLTNLEAAKEISRQIRLRDMGGIIVIDFIDMDLKEHRSQVFETLKNGLRRDKARSKVLNISALGLVEMTRQRMRKSVESLSYRVCPYCNGRGSVKSVTTLSIEVRRKLSQVLKKWPRRPLVMHAHPEVVERVTRQDRNSISYLENRYRRKIIIKGNPSFHIERYHIEEPAK
ncbi:MAG: Rne/Rng family ribonuclease [Candidatus Omnitrophica bacterium]|nr:Rne/Rng family ribonuclease [Candidatus Omnitrophota bacterium]